MKRFRRSRWGVAPGLLLILLVIGCSQARQDTEESTNGNEGILAPLALPELAPVDLEGEKLQVVATSSIIGDVVQQVGGEAIGLTTLIEPGQDPHSFEPSAGELTTVAKAHVIFINGWDLEEGLVDDLSNVAQNTPLVPLSAGIRPLSLSGEEGSAIDPHFWLDPHLVREWVNNSEKVLADLDPANAAVYQRQAATYLAELNKLIDYYDQQIETIPAERRKLVTNHDSFGYFAEAYDFDIVGLVIPAGSTIAEPSSGDLVQLLDQMNEAEVCTIFAETTARTQLAETVTAELKSCNKVQVISLQTGTLGPVGSETDNYLGMMRANINAIVAGVD